MRRFVTTAAFGLVVLPFVLQYIDLRMTGRRGGKDGAPIELNPHSTIAKDLSAAWHDREGRAACVRLREGARCPRPSLVGRLSGPALAALEWEERDDGGEGGGATVHCGSYGRAWLHPGVYFLEIVVVHCRGFGAAALGRGSTREEALAFDFKDECLEDPRNHRITAEGASIEVAEAIDGARGRWVSADGRPLRTRYQPPNCRGPRGRTEECSTAMDNSRLKMYYFDFRDNDVEMKVSPFQFDMTHLIPENSLIDEESLQAFNVSAAVRYLEEKVHGLFRQHKSGQGAIKFDPDARMELFDGPKVCIVGWSHGYHLVHALWRAKLGHRFVWAPVAWPHDISEGWFRKYRDQRNCTAFVVSVGQWPASSQAWGTFGGPWPFGRWRDAVSGIARSVTESDLGVTIYFRSMHRLPIGDWVGNCGGDPDERDWRSPTVVDAYDFIVREVVADCDDASVRYVDARFITNPLWDTGYDWNHVAPRVSLVEALYIASEVLE